MQGPGRTGGPPPLMKYEWALGERVAVVIAGLHPEARRVGD